MLKALFRKSPSRQPAPRVPDGIRVYAIGDIHGRADLFDDILWRIYTDHADRPPKHRVIVLLGDLVDRGPDSAGVVGRAMDIARTAGDVRLIAGNHEEIFLLACQGERDALRLFLRVGGRETVLSYGVTGEDFERANYDELVEILQERVPPAHLEFLRGMDDIVEIGDYAFVHAGIRPGIALADQFESDLRWIRGDFLDHQGDHPKFIVHGHTITQEVDERPNRLGIDTGAYASGKLTAVALEGDRRWFLTTG